MSVEVESAMIQAKMKMMNVKMQSTETRCTSRAAYRDVRTLLLL